MCFFLLTKMVTKKILYFYHSFFGLNCIVSLIASIYGIAAQKLIYLLDLILTLSLIGMYFYFLFKKEDYLGPLTQFFIFYGYFNLLLLWEFWANWPIITISIINFIGIIIYYFINSRRTKRKNN